jgi:hypothetical protein
MCFVSMPSLGALELDLSGDQIARLDDASGWE